MKPTQPSGTGLIRLAIGVLSIICMHAIGSRALAAEEGRSDKPLNMAAVEQEISSYERGWEETNNTGNDLKRKKFLAGLEERIKGGPLKGKAIQFKTTVSRVTEHGVLTEEIVSQGNTHYIKGGKQDQFLFVVPPLAAGHQISRSTLERLEKGDQLELAGIISAVYLLGVEDGVIHYRVDVGLKPVELPADFARLSIENLGKPAMDGDVPVLLHSRKISVDIASHPGKDPNRREVPTRVIEVPTIVKGETLQVDLFALNWELKFSPESDFSLEAGPKPGDTKLRSKYLLAMPEQGGIYEVKMEARPRYDWRGSTMGSRVPFLPFTSTLKFRIEKNEAPVVELEQARRKITDRGPFRFKVTARDPEGMPLKVTFEGKPVPKDGMIEVNPQAPGKYTVSVQAEELELAPGSFYKRTSGAGAQVEVFNDPTELKSIDGTWRIGIMESKDGERFVATVDHKGEMDELSGKIGKFKAQGSPFASKYVGKAVRSGYTIHIGPSDRPEELHASVVYPSPNHVQNGEGKNEQFRIQLPVDRQPIESLKDWDYARHGWFQGGSGVFAQGDRALNETLELTTKEKLDGFELKVTVQLDRQEILRAGVQPTWSIQLGDGFKLQGPKMKITAPNLLAGTEARAQERFKHKKDGDRMQYTVRYEGNRYAIYRDGIRLCDQNSQDQRKTGKISIALHSPLQSKGMLIIRDLSIKPFKWDKLTPDFTGTWRARDEAFRANWFYSLKQNGNGVTGTYGPYTNRMTEATLSDGKVEGNVLTARFNNDGVKGTLTITMHSREQGIAKYRTDDGKYSGTMEFKRYHK